MSMRSSFFEFDNNTTRLIYTDFPTDTVFQIIAYHIPRTDAILGVIIRNQKEYFVRIIGAF